MITVVGLGVVVLLMIGMVVKIVDLRRRRDAEALQLQARISDALLEEPRLSGGVITPTVSVPFWRGSPATIELTGEVAPLELRREVMRLVEHEASRIRQDFRIEDRMAEVPMITRRAA